MATKKRKTTGAARGRKRTAPKRKRKARVGSVASANTLKVGGKTFKKTSCHSTKTAAVAKAKSIRAGGHNARVVKSGKVTCVFKGARTKPGAVRRRA